MTRIILSKRSNGMAGIATPYIITITSTLKSCMLIFMKKCNQANVFSRLHLSVRPIVHLNVFICFQVSLNLKQCSGFAFSIQSSILSLNKTPLIVYFTHYSNNIRSQNHMWENGSTNISFADTINWIFHVPRSLLTHLLWTVL